MSQCKTHSRRRTGKHSPVLSPAQLPSIGRSAWITSTPHWKQRQQRHPCAPKALILTGIQHRPVTLLSLTATCMAHTSNIIVVLGGETWLFKKSENNAIDGFFTKSPNEPQRQKIQVSDKGQVYKSKFSKKKEPSLHDKESPSSSECCARSMFSCPRA